MCFFYNKFLSVFILGLQLYRGLKFQLNSFKCCIHALILHFITTRIRSRGRQLRVYRVTARGTHRGGGGDRDRARA